MLKLLRAARLDASYESEMRRLIAIDLLVLDDFALQPPPLPTQGLLTTGVYMF